MRRSLGGLWGVLLGLACVVPVRADVGAARAEVDAVFSAWSGNDRPGCALAVVQAGTVTYARGYGMANLETGTPITPDSIFDIGSVSKQFTAMAVVLLAQDGRLSLDDDVRKYLPELPDYGTTITVANLLHHTSGLRNYTDLFDLAGVPEVDLTTARDAMELIARQRGINFQPNAEFLYSDTNYFLAGEIVRRVSGQSLRDFSARRIFAPLGMTHTHINDSPREVVPGRATGYEPVAGGYLTYLSNFEQVGDGSVLTTVMDLAKWERNFTDPKVGGPAAIDLLTRVGKLFNGTNTRYGMGLFVDEYRGLEWIHHDGEWVGYRAAVSRFPTEQLSVLVTCNSIGTLDPMDFALRVGELYVGPHLKATARLTGEAEARAAQLHAGLYWSPDRGTVRRFEARDGALTLGGVALVPVGADQYQSGGETATKYRFMRDDGSGRPQLEAYSYGTMASYYRMPGVGAAASSLAEFAGTYRTDDLPATWQLVVEGDHLLRRQSFMHDTELVALFTDTFIGSLSEGDFLIHFVRGKDGRISGFLVSGEMLRPMLLTKVAGAG